MELIIADFQRNAGLRGGGLDVACRRRLIKSLFTDRAFVALFLWEKR